MAHIRKEILIEATPEHVWEAVRDVGAVHRRLCPTVLTDSRLDGEARVVTFATGAVVRELIVDLDDEARRFAYSALGGAFPITHHNSSLQVFADGSNGTRLVWATDVLPNEIAGPIGELIDQGAADMCRALTT